ncbi:helix-turn-helix domain-containing protein [Nocardia camponoti]|uniref:Helix-turn-helix domain-containing protein n=1 Tax=Nocardia camponoti TaxID=1616106 RepID=A0A917QFW1_9NOCA|nr:helix-turn-helix domain-containing protein [Nocardia camponoti]GGK48447.1 hypothetical protein GCM10011591_19790 [Nocardia camponoti]
MSTPAGEPLTLADIDVTLLAVRELITARQRTGAPIPDAVRRAYRRLRLAREAAAVTESVRGQPEPAARSSSDQIGTAEAARALGVSTRHVRRIVTDLDGRKVGRDWCFNSATVAAYADARKDRPA